MTRLLDTDASGNLIIKAGGVGTTQIGDLQVSTLKIADSAVFVEETASLASGFGISPADGYTTIIEKALSLVIYLHHLLLLLMVLCKLRIYLPLVSFLIIELCETRQN